jgi:hypothetical protein
VRRRGALTLALALALAGPAPAAQLRIPALAGGRASVQLVDQAGERPVLGFQAAQWATTYTALDLDAEQVLTLTPTADIAVAGGGATCYLVTVTASGGRGGRYCVQMPDTASVYELRDLAGAAAIDPAQVLAGRLLPPPTGASAGWGLVLGVDLAAAWSATGGGSGCSTLACLLDGPGALGTAGQVPRVASGGAAWEWASVVGEVGPLGPAGPQGPAGAAGADGAPGAAGAAGAAGPQGPAGPQGAAGADGTAGATGPAGPNAISASTSVSGLTGVLRVSAGAVAGSATAADIGAEPAGVAAADITDATTVGRAVLTAASTAAGRTALGVGALGTHASLTDAPSGQSDPNLFAVTKMGGIFEMLGASATRTALGLGTAATTAASAYATAAQGSLAASASQPGHTQAWTTITTTPTTRTGYGITDAEPSGGTDPLRYEYIEWVTSPGATLTAGLLGTANLPAAATLTRLHVGCATAPTVTAAVWDLRRSADWGATAFASVLSSTLSLSAAREGSTTSFASATMAADDALQAHITAVDGGGTAKDCVLTVYYTRSAP